MIRITPCYRGPARGQVFLKKLEAKGDSFSFILPSRLFRLHPAPNPRVTCASDARTQEKITGMRLLLSSSTDELITTTIWQVSVLDEASFDVQYVIQWTLPSPLAPLMSDDVWLWPSVPGTPMLSTGDRLIMDIDPPILRRVKRRSFSVIDDRSGKGYITRRYQCLPPTPLPGGRKYDSLPDLVFHPEQETIKCKEEHYSQPL